MFPVCTLAASRQIFFLYECVHVERKRVVDNLEYNLNIYSKMFKIKEIS